MNRWLRRSLHVTVLAGGFVAVGAAAAYADEGPQTQPVTQQSVIQLQTTQTASTAAQPVAQPGSWKTRVTTHVTSTAKAATTPRKVAVKKVRHHTVQPKEPAVTPVSLPKQHKAVRKQATPTDASVYPPYWWWWGWGNQILIPINTGVNVSCNGIAILGNAWVNCGGYPAVAAKGAPAPRESRRAGP
jgi:hypothetical protein